MHRLRQKPPKRRARAPRRSAVAAGLVSFLLCLGASAVWYVRLGVLQDDSRLRQQLGVRVDSFFALDDKGSTAIPRRYVRPAPLSPAPPVGTNAAAPDPGAPPGPVPAAAAPAFWERIERLLTRLDRARGSMWTLGLRTSLERHLWRGAGAGTWARFHRDQPRPKRIYFAHMHNTYMDLVFEYGVVPMALVLAACALALARIAAGRGGVPRFWMFPLVGMAVMGLGQHLLFAFTSLCLTLPLLLVLARALMTIRKGARPPSPTERASTGLKI